MTELDAGRAQVVSADFSSVAESAQFTFGSGTPGRDSGLLVTIELGVTDLKRLHDLAGEALAAMARGGIHPR